MDSQAQKKRKPLETESTPTSTIVSLSADEMVDRISNIPECIILYILTFLPTLCVVRTSILSKRWRNLWTLVPDVLISEYELRKMPTARFVEFINHIISSNNCAKLDVFDVLMTYTEKFKSDVDVWVRNVTTKRVKDLDLGFSAQPYKIKSSKGGTTAVGGLYVIPEHFYTNDSIKYLSLTGCYISSSSIINWTAVNQIYISDTLLNDDLIHNILKGCPCLTNLCVQDCWGFSKFDVSSSTSLKTLQISGVGGGCDYNAGAPSVLEIRAPYVVSLALTGYFCEMKCELVNASPNLKDVCFAFCQAEGDDHSDDEEDYAEYTLMLINLLNKVSHASTLRIGCWCVKALSTKFVKTSSFQYLNCKHLILDTFLGEFELPGVATLLGISPKMETLHLDSSRVPHEQADYALPAICFTHLTDEDYWTLLQKLNFPLEELKIVKLFDSSEQYCEVEAINALAQFLLKNAPSLQDITVCGKRLR